MVSQGSKQLLEPNHAGATTLVARKAPHFILCFFNQFFSSLIFGCWTAVV